VAGCAAQIKATGQALAAAVAASLQPNQQLANQQHKLLSCRLLQPLQARRRSPVIAPDISYGKGEEQVRAEAAHNS
jgi:hypothetical protein